MEGEEKTAGQAEGGAGGEGGTGAHDAAITELRRENARHRTEKNDLQRQFDELKALVAKELKLEGADPKELQKQLKEAVDGRRRADISTALIDVCDELGTDRKLTRALLREEGLFEDLDPEDSADIKKKVQTLLKSNPKLQKTATPGQSGSDHLDGGGKKKSMNDFIRRVAGR